MAKNPAIMFYTGDWLKDPELSLCEPATRGIWIDLLCAMHELDRCGQVSGTPEQLSRLARCTSVQMSAAIAELKATKAANVTERNGIVTIANRRMQVEYKKRVGVRERVYKHRGKRESNEPSSVSVSISQKESAANAAPDLKVKDHSLENPAVMAFREVQHCWPAAGVPRDSIIAKVMCDDAHLARWRLVLETWRLRGNKPTNVEGMLDWYEHRIPEPYRGNGNGAQVKTSVTEPEEWQKELLEEMRADGQATDGH